MGASILGIGSGAIGFLSELEKRIPASYLGISPGPISPEQYAGDTIRFCMHPSADAAALRILPKIKKKTSASDIVFLLSEITGKSKADIICDLAEGFENKTVVSVVWYASKKHGQRGISNVLNRLGQCSSVIAIPQSDVTKLLTSLDNYIALVLFMRSRSYVNADPDTAKRALGKGGLMHLSSGILSFKSLDPAICKPPWGGLPSTRYNPDLDTVLDYSQSVLLHLIVPPEIPPAFIQYICEYIFSCAGESCEFNFSITVTPDLHNSVSIALLATDTFTETEIAENFWY